MPDGTKLDLMENKNLNVTILPPEYLDTVSPDSGRAGKKEDGSGNMPEKKS